MFAVVPLNIVYHVIKDKICMSVCVCVCLPLCVKQRNDDEAVVDRGGTHYQQRSSFEQEDLEGTLNDTECIWNTKSLKQRVHLLSGFTLLLSS